MIPSSSTLTLASEAESDFLVSSRRFRICETYTELPDVQVAFSPYTDVFFRIFSPEEEVDEVAPLTIDNQNVGIFSISTYPVLPGKPHRSGHPIADVYGLILQEDGSMLASLADGCNWGVKARSAARAASKAFLDYIMTRDHPALVPTARRLGHLLLRGFSTAHNFILDGVDQNISEAGTTTLLGVLVTPMIGTPDWMILACSVGDTKAFLYSHQSNSIDEISGPQSRANAADPGGRLGPHVGPHGDPDLRNLYLQSTKCTPGDILLLVTDGVYDNLDPMYQGVSPRDCGLDADTWDDSNELHHIVRSTYLKNFIRDHFILKDGKPQSSSDIVSVISSYLIQLTQSSRDFHQTQPNKKLPRDFQKYPGKMDHSTAICLRIPTHNSSDKIPIIGIETDYSVSSFLDDETSD